jgi:hypothetical protein
MTVKFAIFNEIKEISALLGIDEENFVSVMEDAQDASLSEPS